MLEEIVVRLLDFIKEKLDWDGLFAQRSINELLYGYNDSVLTLLMDLLPNITSTNRFNFSVSDACVSW